MRERVGGFTLINGIINGEDIDLKLYVPKSIVLKHIEQKLSGMQR